ncbi:uncharacterized protein HMPREF1541_00189 [Cyphellophora europaea CBS 101466]|uniref:Uncharacterized protein n=1 Tax=Cyphellophora europaea (strain CBS 101466) TaxID=1220924 RepID=W2SB99_CYPE1|nr:uncharacterized protein HMPREF1541_00189 [Cyphellophora europaea CBS 101466]ETN46006.1 hypothetical protein HMPREF1541_00189 [Cyphellophora europaea CBS 101466]
MVYQWTQHKDVCYKLYIEERKSLEEIMQHMRDNYNFNPSKRAFQQQFRRWGFPSKQNPAHRNAELVERVKELWEANYTQREMLKTLNEEGYEIKERELMRLRAKNRWLLRIPNGMKTHSLPTEDLSDFQNQILDAAEVPTVIAHVDDARSPTDDNVTKEDLDEILRKRKELHDQRKAESDEKWANKKRRRRTKGYAGLAADPPGPPRFPSETTLDESKVFLGLDNKQYRAMRDQFQAMCEEESLFKKTLAGAEKWQDIKTRLIQNNEQLQQAFWNDKTNLQSKELALDVVCTDVTKRIRSVGRRMTIAEAKNVLGINPEQSRQIRNAFYATLQADKFTSKLETGAEHWQELKDQWVTESPVLQNVFVQGEADPQFQEKQKALEALCRDVMKRLRDDQAKGGSRWVAPTTTTDVNVETQSAKAARAAQAATELAAVQPVPEQNGSAYQFASTAEDLSDLQIDPSLLEAADNFATAPAINPTAVYIRPHPTSQVHSADKVWLQTLTSRSVEELRRLLERKWPNAVVSRIDGVERGADGQEISYLIEEDDELDAYLDHVNGRKATVVVQLNRPTSL